MWATPTVFLFPLHTTLSDKVKRGRIKLKQGKEDGAIRKNQFFYGWVVVLACFLISAAAVGFTNTISIYVIPVTTNLGVSRGQFTLVKTISLLVGALTLPVYSKLTKKIRIKYILVGGLLINSLLFASYGFATRLAHFYGIAVLYGVFVNSSQFLVLGILLNRWFVDKKGMALGIAFAGSGVGGAVMVPIVSKVVEQSWRMGYQVTGLATLLVALPAAIFLVKESPESIGKEAYRKKTTDEPSAAENKKIMLEGMTFAQARKSKVFWILAATLVAIAINASVPNSHGLPHFRDLGYSVAFVSGVESFRMIVLMFGKIGLGMIFDRYGTWVGGMSIALFAIISSVSALMGNLSPIFPWVHALTFGVASAGFSIPVGLYAAQYFGNQDFAIILSFLSMMLSFISASASPIMGLVYDKLGSYTVGWYALIGIAGLIIVGVSTMEVMERKGMIVNYEKKQHN